MCVEVSGRVAALRTSRQGTLFRGTPALRIALFDRCRRHPTITFITLFLKLNECLYQGNKGLIVLGELCAVQYRLELPFREGVGRSHSTHPKVLRANSQT